MFLKKFNKNAGEDYYSTRETPGKPDAFKCIKGQTVVITTKMPFNFSYKELKLFVF